MIVTAVNGQSLFDLAIQLYGSVKYVFELAMANGLSITQELEPGQLLEVPELETENNGIKDYYAANGIKPATAIRDEDITGTPGGACNYCKLFE